ncbi:MAG: hypothetical protein IJN21_05435 [Clostridia bacterium]|nr:hypothetical protein [Clostridia bacterium]
MATSSITKQFIVKDTKAFEKLLAEASKKPERKTTTDSPSLNKGREALRQFSFR